MPGIADRAVAVAAAGECQLSARVWDIDRSEAKKPVTVAPMDSRPVTAGRLPRRKLHPAARNCITALLSLLSMQRNSDRRNSLSDIGMVLAVAGVDAARDRLVT